MILLVGVPAAGLFVYADHRLPALPSHVDQAIETVRSRPLPMLVGDKTGHAQSQGWNIWYESIEPDVEPKGTILLIMGISNDALGWPPQFLSALVHAGYHVVRYDHRGTGLSDWSGPRDEGFSLADMAADAAAVLDAVGVDKAHVAGISLGGMVAQELALGHPSRVASLTSMMSSCHIEDPALPPISAEIATDLILAALRYGAVGGERNWVRLHVVSRMLLRGKAEYTINVNQTAETVIYNLRYRRGYNFASSSAHQAAVRASGSRYAALGRLSMPVLILHGRSDPLIPMEHGIACARSIPGAHVMWVEGMGHDLPGNFAAIVANAIVSLAEEGF